jgi:FAD/FMN-containing dehydrogenase
MDHARSRRAFLRSAGTAAAAMAAGGGWMSAGRALAGVVPPCLGADPSDAAIGGFVASLDGTALFPDSADYDLARRVHGRRHDPRPSIVVRAASESDVARTIAFCRTQGLALAPRSGGHSYIGASGGTGVVLDLGQLRGVTALGGANFRILPGTKLEQVYADLSCAGNWSIPCGSCETVGFGGVTLGGGFGYLQRAHGLTCDRVRAMRVVLADGSTVVCDASTNADLFWALRGSGGGNFGVVTAFEVEAVPAETLTLVNWRWPVAAADEVLARYHELLASGAFGRETVPAVIFNTAAWIEPYSLNGYLFSTGTQAEIDAAKALLVGKRGVAALPGSESSYVFPTPACNPLETSSSAYFKAKSSIVPAAPPAGTGAAIVAAFAERAANPAFASNEYASVNFLALGGAVADVAPAATVFPHRGALSEVQYLSYWSAQPTAEALRAKQTANLAWIRALYAAVDPALSHGAPGSYVNYADEDLAEGEWQTRCYGANHARLQQVKAAVDPSDFFRGRQTVRLP